MNNLDVRLSRRANDSASIVKRAKERFAMAKTVNIAHCEGSSIDNSSGVVTNNHFRWCRRRSFNYIFTLEYCRCIGEYLRSTLMFMIKGWSRVRG